MSTNTDLGEFISQHQSIEKNLIRGILFTVIPFVLGTVITIILMITGKGNPLVSLGFGSLMTLGGTVFGLCFLIPAILQRDKTFKLYSRGIVMTKGEKEQQIMFCNVHEVREHVEAYMLASKATLTHTLELVPESGRAISMAGGSISDFTSLRNGIIDGVTRELVPKLAAILQDGGEHSVKFVILKKEGLLLEKTQGARGQLIPWSELREIDIERSTGHVLIQTTGGTIDTQVWMVGIPIWFLLPTLAETMRNQTNS